MPSEFRRLVFTNAELEEALAASPGGRKLSLPPGRIGGVRFDERQENLLVAVQNGGAPVEAPVPAPIAAAALLWFCIARRIPVPKSARKSLAVSGDNIALELRSGTAPVES